LAEIINFRVISVTEVCTGFWWRSLRERDHWGDPDVDGRIILRWIISKWDVGVWTGSSWLRIGTGGGTGECGNELPRYINAGNCLTGCKPSSFLRRAVFHGVSK
jgi:hypothetical protein